MFLTNPDTDILMQLFRISPKAWEEKMAAETDVMDTVMEVINPMVSISQARENETAQTDLTENNGKLNRETVTNGETLNNQYLGVFQ